MRDFHYNQKYRSGARCRRPHTPRITFKTYPSYLKSFFVIIQVRADTNNTILQPILVTNAMKKRKIHIFMRNFHYHQKYRFGARCRCPRTPTIIFKAYSSYFEICFVIMQVCADADSTILKPILVSHAMKKLKIKIFKRNIDYHQKYRFGAWYRCPCTPAIVFKTYHSYM